MTKLFEETRKANKAYMEIIERNHSCEEENSALEICRDFIEKIRTANALEAYAAWSERQNLVEKGIIA